MPTKWKNLQIEKISLFLLKILTFSVSNVRIIKDKETRRSKGYGFVEMPNDTEGNAAINALNGTNHQERTIVVAEAKGKKETPEPQAEN